MAAYPTKKQKVPHLIFMTNAYPTVLCAKIRQKTVKIAKIQSQLLIMSLKPDRTVLKSYKMALKPNKMALKPEKMVLKTVKMALEPDKMALKPDKMANSQ